MITYIIHCVLDIPSKSRLDLVKMLTMAIPVVEFQVRGYKIRNFLPKNQHTQRKLLNFEKWCNREVKKCLNLTFKVNFLCQKLSESFSLFFH